MKLGKMLLTDVKGVQEVLDLSNQKVIELLEGLLQNWDGVNTCPLFKITEDFDEEIDEAANKDLAGNYSGYSYATYKNYSFQPYGRRGSSWWYRLFNDEKKEAIRLLIDYLKKEQRNEVK